MDIGKVSESALKRSVLKYVQLNNKAVRNTSELLVGAGVGTDAAVLKSASDKVVTTTQTRIGRKRSVVVEAMIAACNNISCMGANAEAVQISLVLPEEAYESELRHMMEEALEFTKEQQIFISGGHTTVSPYVTETVATVTAIGTLNEWKSKQPKAGMDIVISKWIGLEGTVQIANAKTDELEKRLPKWFVANAQKFNQYALVIDEASIATKEDVAMMHDASGGGIFRALWEVAEYAGTGLRVELKKIPLKQETVEVCEVFGLNPYELLSGGALLMVTEHGESLVEKLVENEIEAAVIGTLTDDKDKVIVTHGDDGEELRYLDKPKTDEIDKIL